MMTNSVGQVSYVNPAFKAEQVKTEAISPQTKITYTTKPDEFVKENKDSEQKGMSTSAVVATGAGIVAAVALAVIGIKKGKGLLSARKAAKELAEKATREAAELTKLKQISIADFKKVGIFEKGKALIDGKGFTGTIEICKEKGTKKIYENGILKETLRNGQRRVYEQNGRIKVFDNNGVLKKIFYRDANGAKIISKKVIENGVAGTSNEYKKLVLKKDGSIDEYMLSQILRTDERNIERFKKSGINKGGGSTPRLVHRYDVGLCIPSGEKRVAKVHKIIDGKKATEYYDTRSRKLFKREIPIYYNPKTGEGLSYIEDMSMVKPLKGALYRFKGREIQPGDINPEDARKLLSGDKDTITRILAYLKS